MNKIALVIPSLEPDEKLIKLLDTLDGQFPYQDVIIVNDGSASSYDHFFEEAQAMGCKILRHGVNLGKGRALKTAFNEIILQNGYYSGVVIADSDGQHSVRDILKCAKVMEEKPHALILGCRDFSSDNVPFKSRYGNILTRNVMKIFCGLNITDTQTGLRGISLDFMKILMNVKGERFEFETNMLLATKEHEIEIVEVPIETIYINDNSSSHFNPVKDSIRIYTLFGKFIFSSVASFVVDIILFQIAIGLLHGMAQYILIATVAARVLSSLFNFTVNKNGVFKSKSKDRMVVVRYYILCICQMLVSAGAVTVLHSLLQGNETLIKMIVDFVLFLLSFQIQREWVFRR